MVADNLQNGTTIEVLAISGLKVDAGYQRALGAIHVDSITNQFDPTALGVIAVSQRRDGDFYIIDGHHRWIACKRVGQKYMKATVHHGLSRTEEAAMFLSLNFSKVLTPAGKFNARVLMQEPQVLDICAVVESCGFKVVPTHGATTNSIAAISKLDYIYEHYGTQMISAVLRIIRHAWPDDTRAREASMLGGLAKFLAVYPKVSTSALAQKLGGSEARTLLQVRKMFMREFALTSDLACARAIWQHWNKGRRAGRLQNLFDPQ